jgi:hypothetical protein
MPRLTKRSLAAVLWHALAYQAKKLAVRAELADGSRTPIDLESRGVVNGQAVHEQLCGHLTVGHESSVASSSAAPAVDVVAYLLAQLPEQRRNLELTRLPKLFAEHAGVPSVDESIRDQSAALLKQLRTQETTSRAGAVRFEPQPPTAVTSAA